MHGISLRLGVIWFCATPVVCTLGWLALCWWVSTLPAVTDVSLSLAFRPWWRHWEGGLFVGFLLGIVTGVFATFHSMRNPVIKKED
jgi:hypothetical protein